MQLLDLRYNYFSKQKERKLSLLLVLRDRLYLPPQIAKKELQMSHLTEAQRYTIEMLYNKGFNPHYALEYLKGGLRFLI
jgi:hypothetical protein